MDITTLRRTLAAVCISAVALVGALAAACGNPRAANEATEIAVTPASSAAVPSESPPAQLSAPGNADTPELVTPVPAIAVRADCPGDWAVATEAHFSFCYPSELRVLRQYDADLPDYNIESPPTPADEVRQNTFLLAVAERDSVMFDPALGCPPIGSISNSAVEVTIGAHTVTACSSASMDSDASGEFELRSLRATIDWTGKPIEFLLTYRGPDFDATRAEAMQILASIEAA